MSSKKVLAILSEYGYWGIELVGPLNKLEAAGYKVEFMTPNGKAADALPPSYDPEYTDPPLGVCVTTAQHEKDVKEFIAKNRTASPLSLKSFIPERPYHSAPDFLRKLEAYYVKVKESVQKLTSEYDALLLVGGSGPIVDMVNNQSLHELILGFYHKNLPIAGICYGVAPLAFARDFNERKCIIRGKHVTGHCIEYDYHDGTGFLHTDFNIGPPPYVLEYVLTDAVGSEGQYHGNFGKETSVILDYPFLTARSLQCSYEFGEVFVQMLEKGLKRYGW
ncbi:MAG: type 1 glutamine amidotransferase domain-containing protein [Bacteroidota bacterium]|nr:type 1 glutamine amidotransferase domain-containing protein [Bacteroidota bacterium]